MIKKPRISEEVIKYLDELFPDKCPNLEDNEKQVWFKSGQASVVKHLKQLLDDQNKNILNNNIIKRK